MTASIGVHKLTSEAVAFDFSRQRSFVDNPTMTITGVSTIAAHDENGEDVSDETFDAENHPHQIAGLVVKVWIHTPPAGELKITLAVATENEGVTGAVVWESAHNELPVLDVNADGADA